MPWSILPRGFLWEQGKPRTSFPYWGSIFIWGPHPPFFGAEEVVDGCISHDIPISHQLPVNHHFSAPWISMGEIGWSSHPPVSWDHLDHERHAQEQLLPSVAGGGDPKGRCTPWWNVDVTLLRWLNHHVFRRFKQQQIVFKCIYNGICNGDQWGIWMNIYIHVYMYVFNYRYDLIWYNIYI